MALNDVSILVVEDDPVFRSIMSSFLSERGATVVEACDGECGLTLFKQQEFDIIIADLSMPKMGGLEMLKLMIQNEPIVPSIVISGNNLMADVVEALRIGASDYIVKPVSDLFSIEQAIIETLMSTKGMVVPIESTDPQTYQELKENLNILEHNAHAARCVQQQLFPSFCVEYPKAKMQYSLFHSDEVSAYFIDSVQVDVNHLIMYMVHFQPEDNRAAFASVMLHSFVKHKLNSFRSGLSDAIIEPFNMLSYLNERLIASGIDLNFDICYVTIELNQYRAAIARSGTSLRCYLRHGDQLTPLAIADSLQMGTLEWSKPNIQFRTLNRHEQLCIATNTEAHRQLLLADSYQGDVYGHDVPQGGFVQLSI